VPPWSDPFWVPVGLLVGVVGVFLTWLFWFKPRSPKHGKLRVVGSTDFLLYDQPDGTKQPGDLLIGVTLHNGSPARAKVVGWGLRLPGNRRMVVPGRLTPIEPLLPHWVEPGDDAEWYLDAAEVRRQQASLGCKFSQMVPYVTLADGRELRDKRGVLLK